jgi:energy-coupling factor transporter ATP-binding protein EcfA2
MSTVPVCWRIEDVQYATQVDVGGLEVGDPTGDAVFLAVHQSVPIQRMRKAGDHATTQKRSETDVLEDLTSEITSPAPHLLFITGHAGSGKSHLVRWLRSRVGEHRNWHIIYVEKRNTSLRRIIEKILDGIDTPRATELRAALAKASSELRTVDEAMHALLQRLEHLVRFDPQTSVGALSGADLVDLRDKAGRLLGDYLVKEWLSRSGGPIERITELAMPSPDGASDDDVIESDLHIAAADLLLEPADFVDAGAPLQRLVRSVVSNVALRQDLAMLMDHYLARAKADVFTGRTADLLDVFEEVRREIGSRGQELCLFIEDLVLLHGIDTELAQALTIPATADLCRIRAVIAVTEGYLRNMTTFAERGVHYTMDVERSSLATKDLRSFVARYLNAGRVGRATLREANERDEEVPNACGPCPHRKSCHATFGATPSGLGYYPFNEEALDFLVERASPSTFDPRTILREVVRYPLEVADAELRQPGVFPSRNFAASLDPQRSRISVERQAAIQRESANGDQELSLRGLYGKTPPFDDAALTKVATWFGVALTVVEGRAAIGEEDDPDADPGGGAVKPPAAERNPLDRWVQDKVRLPASEANKIRNWLLETLAMRLQTGPHGVIVRKEKPGEWSIGSVTLRLPDFVIENAGGSGAATGAHVLEFRANAEDATMLKGILAVANGGSFAGPDRGRWYFEVVQKLSEFEGRLLKAAQALRSTSDGKAALAILSISQHSDGLRAPGSAELLKSMLRTPNVLAQHPAMASFVAETKDLRRVAVRYLRDNHTEKKGTGACTVFDAGPLVKALREVEAYDEVPEISGCSDEMARALRALRERQQRAASAVWGALRPLAQRLQAVLDPSEDLAETFAKMDRLIDDAHNHGLLPGVDVRSQYHELRGQVSSEAMAHYRYVCAHPGPATDSATVWSVAGRVDETLDALLKYTDICVRVLSEIEGRVTTVDSSGGAADRVHLDSAFRDLADELDRLEGLK